MEKHIRTEKEILDALREQRLLLRASCENFDNGLEVEAKRIATIVNCLLRDGGRNSKSIVSQAGIKESLNFFSSSRDIPKGTFPSTRLATLHVSSSGGRFLPLCRSELSHPILKSMPFSRWWDEIVIQSPPKSSVILGLPRVGPNITRKNLVANLRDKDGGAHVDPELTDQAYIDASIRGNIGNYILDLATAMDDTGFSKEARHEYQYHRPYVPRRSQGSCSP